MTKFQKAARKAETLQRIYDAIESTMGWDITWDDEEQRKPYDEIEATKYEVYQEVFKAIEKMI